MGRSKVFRYSKERTLTWLQKKVTALAKQLEKEQVYPGHRVWPLSGVASNLRLLKVHGLITVKISNAAAPGNKSSYIA